MTDYNFKIDLSPYLPDSYLKENIYQSMDFVDYTTNIGINTTIFIFNINCSENELEYYNDPGYLLYGIKKKIGSSPETDFNYTVPPTYFFNYPLNKIKNNFKPYIVVESIDKPNQIINDLLIKIGYDVNLLKFITQSSPYKILNFSYQVLKCIDLISRKQKEVIYIFFNIKNLDQINYNNYNSVVYNNLKYNNVYIYPYINTNPQIPIISLNKNLNLIYDKNNYLSNSTNYINPIDFDDKEILKYYEKIDYKYMERRDYYLSSNNKLDLLVNLSKNYKLYENFFISSKKSLEPTIMISNNEISKVYFSNSDYENKNLNSYTLSKLNNQYINNNLSFSGKDKKYSFTLNGKISYVQKLLDFDKFRYTPYNFQIINTPSIYQMSKNYYVNTYINLISSYNKDLNSDILFETNCLLYKILITINPYIINLLYLISSNVQLKVSNLFKDCNELKFGSSTDKINLYFVNKLKTTQTFYIDKYKIEFNFKINDIEQTYIIILGLCVFNGNNLNILNIDGTKNTNDLAYILFTNEDCSVSLCPQLYNLTDKVNIYEQKDLLLLYGIKNLSMETNINSSNNLKDVINTNFYTFIPLTNPDLNNYQISNIFNITQSKLNNFIKNLINISTNVLNLIDNNLLLNFTDTLVYDYNLELNKYIENYNYFPKIQLNNFLPNTINKYKLFTNIPETINSLVQLPAGNYKIIKYKNFFPEYTFNTVSESNDKLVLTINNINDFLKNNFVLFIKLPNNLVPDDKFIVDLEDLNKENYLYSSNYSFNIGPSETFMYLVVSDEFGNPYINSQNIIYGYELFNFYNSPSSLNIDGNKYKIKLNLFFNTYLNFFQMVFISTIFKIYSDGNNSIIDISNTKLLIHNKDLLKDIVYYDFIRFNYPCDLVSIKSQFNSYDPSITIKLYSSKYYANLIKTDIARLSFVFNTNKIVVSIKKIYYYLSNYIISQVKNPIYINIINYLANLCLDISKVNYQIGTTYSINSNYCQNILYIISKLTILDSFEYVNGVTKNVKLLILYFEEKILQTIKDIIFNYDQVNLDPNAPINIVSDYKLIFELVGKFELNILILDQLSLDISNLYTDDVVATITKIYPELSNHVIRLLIESILNFLHLMSLNSKKLDELFNTVRIIYDDQTIDSIYPNGLTNNVVKNMFVFNTKYYNSLGINNFNICGFLNDLIVCIGYFSNPLNNSPTSYIYYVAAINENIIGYISNTIKYFNLINEQIISMYKYIHNINIGLLPKINPFDANSVSDLYYLITIFKESYTNMNLIITNNKINIFQEFSLVIDFFNNYIGSIEDYLFYVETKLYFTNLNTFNQNIFLDILKILEITEFYSLINLILKIIDGLANGDQNIINSFLTIAWNNLNSSNLVLKSPEEEYQELKTILSNYNYQNKNVFNLIKKYVINSYIIVNNIPDLNNKVTNTIYQAQDVIIIRDYNILYPELSYSSFNFNLDLLVIVLNSIKYQIDILDYYYTQNLDFYKQLINYNYLNIKNISINQSNNDTE